MYADDLNWSAGGARKFHEILLILLAWEAFGTPIAWHKVKGGFQTDWVGYWLDYHKFELGISESRARWLAGWLMRATECGGSFVRELREALGRLGFAAGVLEWHRPFLAPIYAWVAAAPASSYLPHPPAVQLALLHLRERFMQGGRTVSCRPRAAAGGVAYFADAAAEAGKITLGGWEAVESLPPYRCRWYSIEVTAVDVPWLFPGGHPSKCIAAAELLATLSCLTLFGPTAPVGSAGVISVTSAFTDNKGNTYAASKLMSTRYPLSCVVMELATQMEARGLWLDLCWTPREQHVLADKLTNGTFSDFDPRLRVASKYERLSFVSLSQLLAAGAELKSRTAAVRADAAGRSHGPPPRTRKPLRTREPL